MTRLIAYLPAVFGWRWMKVCIVVFGLLLTSTSLTSGLAADDFFHQLLLTQNRDLPGVHGRKWDLFTFADGDPRLTWTQIDNGMVGWWTDLELKISYFRPLSAATHVFDHDVLGNSVLAMHIHSLLWFGAGLVGLAFLYARFHAPATAAFALLLYAIDDAHGFAISWIANRNALIALALGIPVLLLHDVGRRDGRREAAWCAPAMLFVALLAGESAVAVCAYLCAYAVFFEEGSPKRRIVSLVPYVGVLVLWRVIYAALGYGTRNSGLALDPVSDPLGYALALTDRAPALLLATFALPPSDLWVTYRLVNDWLPWLMRGIAVAVLVSVSLLLWPRLRTQRTARFWACGTVLAILPGCAQVPHDRLLFYAGIGAMPLVTELFQSLLWLASSGSWVRRAPAYGAFVLFFVIHVPYAIWGLPLRARGAADTRRMLSRADRTIPETVFTREQTIVLVNPPNDAFGGYIVMQRAVEARPRPKHLHWLATGTSQVTLERLDGHSVRVTPEKGFLFFCGEWMQRSPSRPMPLGYTISLSEVTFRVELLNEAGRPAAATARFREPLDSPSLRFLEWTERGYRPFVLPEVGGRITLPKVNFLALGD